MIIRSIFNSLDGEVNRWGQGTFTTFVRFGGCAFGGKNIHCSYCDTKYSQAKESGTEMSIQKIVNQVKLIGCEKVTITGGEPFVQRKELIELVDSLLDNDFGISLETNGSYDVLDIPPDVCIVMDYKLSNSGIPKSYMKTEHFTNLQPEDFVKMVVDTRESYEEAIQVKEALMDSGCEARFAFSPMWGILDPAQLFDWLQKDQLFDVILNLQLHKIIWPNVKEGEER
jgi:7-carboxy-7-deazaguanine synthase